MPPFFDTHCHLNFQIFSGKIKKTIERAQKNNVSFFMVPGADLSSSQRAIRIAQKYPFVYAAVGIHPHHAFELKKSAIPQIISSMEKLIKNKEVKAIGEIGLDKHEYQKTKYRSYQVNKAFLKKQKILFQEQLRLAIKHKKAVIIHSRNASKEVLSIIDRYWQPSLKNRLVFHCAEPSKKILSFALSHEAFLGIDGDITYYQQKQQFIRENVPLKRIVLETDSPYLSPLKNGEKIPFPNEPAYLPLVGKKLAQEKEVSLEKVAQITTQNAHSLFGINH